MSRGKYTADGDVFDYGETTIDAIKKYWGRKHSPTECGGKGIYSNGNGSLMRMLPIAFYISQNFDLAESEIVDIVRNVSSLTHAHEISVLGSYIYVKLIDELLMCDDKKHMKT